MTSKTISHHKVWNKAPDLSQEKLPPLRFPSNTRLLRKKTHQVQKTLTLRESLAQLLDLHRRGPPLAPSESENEETVQPPATNSDNLAPAPVQPSLALEEHVRDHIHLLDRLSYLLRLVSPSPRGKAQQHPPTSELEDLVQAVRLSLCSEWPTVRAAALQCLRVLLRTPGVDKDAYRHSHNWGLDILITRSLDSGFMAGGYDLEMVQAMRLLYLFVQKYPSEISLPVLASLVSIASCASSENKVFRTSLALLALLATKQPQLLKETGGIRTLVQGVLTCSDMHMNESLICAAVSLLSHPSTRATVNLLHEFQPLLAPFTDPHYIPHFFETNRKDTVTPADLERAHEQARKQAVSASTCAFISLFLNWSGMFALTQNYDKSSLRGFLEMLPLVTPLQQHAMLDALYRILLINPPSSSSLDQLFDTLPSSESCDRRTRSLVSPCYQGQASLSEDWVAHESEMSMPNVSKSRTDLALCYRVLTMSILLDQHLLVRLLEVSLRSPEPVIVKAIILAKEILLTVQKLFPIGLNISEETDTSINNFLKNETRGMHSKVVLLLQRLYLMERDTSNDKFSRFLLLLVKPPRSQLLSVQPGSRAEEAGLLLSIEQIAEEISQGGTKNYRRWDWMKINSTFITMRPTPALVQKLAEVRLIQSLINFFLPSSNIFNRIPLKAEFDHFVQVGINLITFLICSSMSTKLSPLLHELMEQLRFTLKDSSDPKCIINDRAMESTQTQAYFLFLGHVAHLNSTQLKDIGYYGLLFDLFTLRPPNKTLIKLLLPTLVYYGSAAMQSYSLLQVAALTNECQDTRVFCIKFLRTLLRCQKSSFSSQGVRLLALLLYDESSAVREQAIMVLDEACELRKHLTAFSALRPQISHLSLHCYLLFIRLFSLEENFHLFNSALVLQQEVKKWQAGKNVEYVELVERVVAEGFTRFVHTEPGEFKRRSTVAEIELAKKQVFIPVHLYGQLAAHYEGCNYIKTENLMDPLIDTIKQQRLDETREVLEMKAAVWALGHIGSQNCGIELLIEENLIDDLVDMCCNCPVLSIRGACFYAICLIAKTSPGSDVLNTLGWVSVRHGNETRWPLVHDSLRQITSMLEQESVRDDVSISAKSASIKNSNRAGKTDSLLIPEKSEFEYFPAATKDNATPFVRKFSPEPIPTKFEPVPPLETSKSLSSILLSRGRSSSSFSLGQDSRNLAMNPNLSKTYLGLAIPIQRDAMVQIPPDKPPSVPAFSSLSSANELNWEMKRDPNKIQIVVMDTTGKFRHRTHTGDSAFSSQSGMTSGSPSGLAVPSSHSPYKKTSTTYRADKEFQTPPSGTSDMSGSVTMTSENVIDSVSQLSSNLSVESKRSKLIKMKAKYPLLFTDLQTYLQVINLLSNYRFTLENRKFIQALFDQNVFDCLFENLVGSSDVNSPPVEEGCKSLTPDLSDPTRDHTQLKVDEELCDTQSRRRCSTGDATKLKKSIKKDINNEEIVERVELRIPTKN